jgi:E3 ubiquitin-protein ligase RNF14
MNLPEKSPRRLLYENRYGKANLQKLIAKVKEDLANKAWMDASTQACPICTVRVQKSMGCNHMTCWKCGGHFCYRCGAKLKGTNPYSHFSTPGIPCYNQLFDEIPDDDGWQPMEGFNHL